MSLALYRKYRPSLFEDVVGQDHIVRILKKTLAENTISHAYLFSGSRGLGKTSIARILARELGVKERDVYEIDAASNRGIDDIRALREEVQTLPFESPYKMYIVDECHMLTKEAFNALLKTLEEPPAHAKFVLATTEMHKLPDTIISRCEVHHFNKPNHTLLTDHVINTAKKEGFQIEKSAASIIATLGDGSYRDTLGALQKVLSSAEGKVITEDDVERVTNAPKSTTVNNFLKALDAKDIEAGLEAVHSATKASIDMKLFVELIIQKIRLILLLRHANGFVDMVKDQAGEDDLKTLQEMAGNKSSGILSKTLLCMLDIPENLKSISVKEIPFELALIELFGNE